MVMRLSEFEKSIHAEEGTNVRCRIGPWLTVPSTHMCYRHMVAPRTEPMGRYFVEGGIVSSQQSWEPATVQTLLLSRETALNLSSIHLVAVNAIFT